MLTHHTIRKLYKGEIKLQQDHFEEHDCRRLDQAHTLKCIGQTEVNNYVSTIFS